MVGIRNSNTEYSLLRVVAILLGYIRVVERGESSSLSTSAL